MNISLVTMFFIGSSCCFKYPAPRPGQDLTHLTSPPQFSCGSQLVPGWKVPVMGSSLCMNITKCLPTYKQALPSSCSYPRQILRSFWHLCDHPLATWKPSVVTYWFLRDSRTLPCLLHLFCFCNSSLSGSRRLGCQPSRGYAHAGLHSLVLVGRSLYYEEGTVRPRSQAACEVTLGVSMRVGGQIWVQHIPRSLPWFPPTERIKSKLHRLLGPCFLPFFFKTSLC